MLILILILIVLAGLYLLALRCRRNHPGLKSLRSWNYAHRGLHDDTLPENSMGAFRAALEAGYGIELDIHLLRDGTLAVIHDSLLKRTTGAEGTIEDLTAADLSNYHLEGTGETIPTFREVLSLFDGKAPMIVELKAHGGNHAALAKAACELLDTYAGPFCVESFDPRCILWLRKHRPDVIRGQLSTNFFKGNETLSPVLKFLLTHNLLSFLTVPDFIAYDFPHRKNAGNFLCSRLWGAQMVYWTLRTKEDFDTAVAQGALPIFENFRP